MLKVGDKISRQMFIEGPKRKHGVITEIYKSRQGFYHTPQKLYAIKWDDGIEDRGYFEVSLEKEDY